MLTEYFLDNCLLLCCSLEDTNKKTAGIMEAICNILFWYDKEIAPVQNKELDNNFVEKLELTKILAKYRKSYNSNFILEDFLEKLQVGRFSGSVDFLKSKKENLDEDLINKLEKKIYSKFKLCELLRGKKDIHILINDIEIENYDNEDEIIQKWEFHLKNLYDNLQRINSKESLEKLIKINLKNDSFDGVVKSLRESLNDKETTRTGYQCIDNKLPSKGFEPRRLYLIGGSSGVGKSIFLLNLVRNAVTGYRSKDLEKPNYYLYITAENLIDESMLRLYCGITGESSFNVSKRLQNDVTFNFESAIYGIQKETNSVIIFCYVEAKKTKINTIDNMISQIYDESKGRLKGVYLDYLDLIGINDNTISGENIRLIQSIVSQELKNLSIKYSTSIITASQLNRSGYDVDSTPTLTQMGESMHKIDNSDFVMFLQYPKILYLTEQTEWGEKRYKRIRCTILKNRNGPIGDSVYLGLPEYLNNENIFNYRFEELPNGGKNVDDNKLEGFENTF